MTLQINPSSTSSYEKQQALIASDIDAYLEQHRTKPILRFLTCGSVDDGKSTLIGRLLHDTHMIYEDQLAAVLKDSGKHGTTGDAIDLALLVDGLKSEREQGITIDVAYRYFSTERRKFIIADCPGHEQYTRNMATGASNCDLAVILIDARKGVLEQTKRHAFIVSLLGIKHVIVAVNKMDLVGFDERVFKQICSEFVGFAARLEMGDLNFVPVSALTGDNVVATSDNSPWYGGSTLLHLLENVHVGSDRNLVDLRFPVQYVLRPNLDFRGFAGTIASGVVRVGDKITVSPSGVESTVKGIHTYDGELLTAFAPMSVVLTLTHEVDVSRGDLLVHRRNRPKLGRDLEAMMVWMDGSPLVIGKEYLLRQGCSEIPVRVEQLLYGVDVNTLSREHPDTLSLNQVGRCTLRAEREVSWDPYKNNRQMGALVLIDRKTNATCAAGMLIDREPMASGNSDTDHWQTTAPTGITVKKSVITPIERQKRYQHKAMTVLICGLTRAGKTTVALALEQTLFEQDCHVVRMDGQELRAGVSKDLGFTEAGRRENLRRFGEISALLNRAGSIVVGAMVAPYANTKQQLLELLGQNEFLLVHLDCPLSVCEERDQSGLYRRATEGKILDFPGVNAPYENPKNADLMLASDKLSVQQMVAQIMAAMQEREIFGE